MIVIYRDKESRAKWWLQLPWGHWLWLDYRQPERSTAIGVWALFDPISSASLSLAVLVVSFVVGYRWSTVNIVRV